MVKLISFLSLLTLTLLSTLVLQAQVSAVPLNNNIAANVKPHHHGSYQGSWEFEGNSNGGKTHELSPGIYQ